MRARLIRCRARVPVHPPRSPVTSPTLDSPADRSGSGPDWVKSSLSYAFGNCVEVASLPGGQIGVRNSRDPHGAVLSFTPDEWVAFLAVARPREFDPFPSPRYAPPPPSTPPPP